MIRRLGIAVLFLTLIPHDSHGAELVRGVRFKISAGDLPSGIAAVEDYKRTSGVDAEYLDAIGWLARGAQMLGRDALARQYVAELRHEIPVEKPELVVPQGIPIVIDTETMVRYGASATPTFALIDREGIVRLYTPTKLSEAELSRRIEQVLRGAPTR